MIKNLLMSKPSKKLTKRQLAKLGRQRNQTLKVMLRGLKPSRNGQLSPFLVKKEPNFIRVHGGPTSQGNMFMRINRLRSSKSRKYRASLQLGLVSGFQRWSKLTKQIQHPLAQWSVKASNSFLTKAESTEDYGLSYLKSSPTTASWNLLTALEIAPASIWMKMGFAKSYGLSKQTLKGLTAGSAGHRSSACILNYECKLRSSSWDVECLLKRSIAVKRISIS